MKKKASRLFGNAIVITGILGQLCSSEMGFCSQRYTNNSKAMAALTKEAQKVAAEWEPSDDFIAYMKKAEGYRANPYDSFEGGNKTVGIGHKLKDGETVKEIKDNEVGYGHHLKEGETMKGLTEKEAGLLLVKDLKEHYIRACRQWGYVPKNRIVIEMMTEYCFNACGPLQFPQFYTALKECDQGKSSLAMLGKLQQQYKRHAKDKSGALHEMTRRNNLFANRYFTLENFSAFSGTTSTGLMATGFDLSALPKNNQLAAKALLAQIEKLAKVKAPTPQQATSSRFAGQSNQAAANGSAKAATQKAYYDKYLKGDIGNNGLAMR